MTNHDAGAGRFAPSPSGDLHVGNLRTALLAWLFARSTCRRFVVRMEDLDRVQPGSDGRQLADLASVGLDWDGPVIYQSKRTDRYTEAVERLMKNGLTYWCFCTRREIREAASAPHPDPAIPDRLTTDGSYPGTCRNLSAAEIAERQAGGRPSALRLRANVDHWTIQDELLGRFTGVVDDVVLRRNDGVAAYNLAVVVDDAAQGIDQIVRADDLLTSAPRQAYLGSLLGLPAPPLGLSANLLGPAANPLGLPAPPSGLSAVTYAHVPLALNIDGKRLAKRDGAVTLADLVALGRTPRGVVSTIAASLDLAEPGEQVLPVELLDRFDPARLPRTPWIVRPAELFDVPGSTQS